MSITSTGALIRVPLCFVIASGLLLGACGSSGSHASSTTSPTTASNGPVPTTVARTAQLESYCTWARRFQDASARLDKSTPASYIEGLTLLAEAEHTWAQYAPAQLAAAHRDLVASADELVQSIKARAPTTLEQVQSAANDATAQINQQFPKLEQESAAVTKFARDNCGLSR